MSFFLMVCVTMFCTWSLVALWQRASTWSVAFYACGAVIDVAASGLTYSLHPAAVIGAYGAANLAIGLYRTRRRHD